MPAHVHAALMAEYAKDAAASDTPWENWEVMPINVLSPSWDVLYASPQWRPDYHYRRKPRTITINGIEVPEPLRVAPGHGAEYYATSVYSARYIWNDNAFDHALLKNGMCHSTPEAAAAHAKAIIAASGGATD